MKRKFLLIVLIIGIPIATHGAIVYIAPSEPLLVRISGQPDEVSRSFDLPATQQSDFRVTSAGFDEPTVDESVFRIHPESDTRVAVGAGQIGTKVSAPPTHRFAEDEWIGPELPGDLSWTGSRSNLLVHGEQWGFGSDPAVDPPDFTWQAGEFYGEIGFLGFELGVDDDVLFGWVRVDGSQTEMVRDRPRPVLYIIDWAYNTVPGEPIRAGEIPEPRAFALVAGLLSLALIGARRWRRRRL